MPKPTKGPRLGSGPAHQRLMLGGLASALIREERIRTTEAKAKRLRPVADRLVTLGKAGTVHARRRALRVVEDREVVHKLFDEVAPRFAERRGGYTRVLKLGPRKGDAAPMAIIEFVEEAEVEDKSAATTGTAPKRRGIRRRRKGQEPAAQPAGQTPPAAEDERPQTEESRPTELVGPAEAGESDEVLGEETEVFMTGDADSEAGETTEEKGGDTGP